MEMEVDNKIIEFDYDIKSEDGSDYVKLIYCRSKMYKMSKSFLIWYPIIFMIILVVPLTFSTNIEHVKFAKSAEELYESIWSLIEVIGIYFIIGIVPVVIIPKILINNTKKAYIKSQEAKESVKYIINSEGIEIYYSKKSLEYKWEELSKTEYNEKYILIYDKRRILNAIPIAALTELDKDTILNFARYNIKEIR
ncbi:MAG TPA: hypothetical protein DEP72_02370 [Clostridiales bacterium]|nr:MAG: hypothetical protein A2Y18_01305 [Clostridiales bacterium GWD2_32_19]HCC07001.1 hypothetical protein [Clostridiales bacterium]